MTQVLGTVDPRQRFKTKKKAQSLQSKTPLVIDDSGELLLRPSRSPSIPGYDCQLHNAIMIEDVEAVRSLLEAEVLNINGFGAHGITVLHHACTGGNLEIVKLLVEAGADIGLPTKDGKTPLSLAVSNGYFDVSEYLILKGAKDIEIKDGLKVKPT
ncbi:notch-regulated ankyrin repeat-containing protein [Hydra vulgaris]|uniref:notch-regulated ankyrin repeat-containing protein n=1 Tax=Hydra vulgaris TaxID=6087 RepID=UPI0002B4A00C|nr:notch-regulated ankyrin repeat-containing protein [Hydra vulgaris]XP_047143955.1 notch-regulated ankyrin repeat-containing protein [Hydra vulgaris]XP_047143956.1 notch-regulated ankyrin repeat-containing protein [Hydra vulgaris]XP_047143957.1 notch-regulated ankyrin repeat-containing protein [Hydra vulgaris]